MVDGLDVYGFSHIKEIISFLEGTPFDAEHIDILEAFRTQHHYGLDFSNVTGVAVADNPKKAPLWFGQMNM